jgi:hypothetical protein
MNKYKKFIIPAIILVGGLAFIFKDKLFKKKASQDRQDDNNNNNNDNTNTNTNTGGGGGVSRDAFPLKRGSRGSNVKDLQQAILVYDKTLLPKYGADSDFGSETETAVVKILGKKTVDNRGEIDKIRNMKSTTTTTTTNPNAERIRLANDLVSKWKQNKGLTFITTNTTKIGLYFVTDNLNNTGVGVQREKGSETLSAGTKLESGTNVKNITVNSQGFMSLYLKNSRSVFSVVNMVYVSPYAIKYV